MIGASSCGGAPTKAETPTLEPTVSATPAAKPADDGIVSADAGELEVRAIPQTSEERRLEDAIHRTAAACAPPAKWSECEDAIAGLKATRRKEASVSDVFLLDLLERDRNVAVRRVVGTLLVDLDRASPLLRDRALAARLLDAADRESNPDVASVLIWAIGNVDLETTMLDERIRDFALARKESLGGNFPARVVHNAALSPRAANVISAWLASAPSPFRRIIQLSVSTEANARRDGASFCAAMLELGKREPSDHRAALDVVSTGEGCTASQRSAAKAALRKR
jgi:hypothetical protein